MVECENKEKNAETSGEIEANGLYSILSKVVVWGHTGSPPIGGFSMGG